MPKVNLGPVVAGEINHPFPQGLDHFAELSFQKILTEVSCFFLRYLTPLALYYWAGAFLKLTIIESGLTYTSDRHGTDLSLGIVEGSKQTKAVTNLSSSPFHCYNCVVKKSKARFTYPMNLDRAE